MSQFLQYFGDGLAQGGLYALIALGYTMVYGVIQLINFAHGEIFMVGAFGGVALYDVLPSGLPVGIALVLVLIAAMFSSVVVAVLMERFAYRPLRNAPRLAPLITAIGVSTVLQQLVQKYFPHSTQHSFPSLFPAGTIAHITYTKVFTFVLALVFMVSLQIFVSRTRAGRAMRATAQDPDTAKIMGIDTDRIIVLTFVLGALLAGIAGVFQGMIASQVSFNMGYVAGLKAFTAAVLGGIGNIAGAVLGGLTLGVVEALATGYIPRGSAYKDVWAFVVLIIVLLFRPSGLLGESVRSRS